MKYPGTHIFTDGSKLRRGAACYTAIILYNDRFICEITNAFLDVSARAGQLEIEAIRQAIVWVAAYPDMTLPPYRLYTDYEPFVRQYNRADWENFGGSIGSVIRKGKELELEVCFIASHAQEHSGNKVCDITCRALCYAVWNYRTYPLVMEKAVTVVGHT